MFARADRPTGRVDTLIGRTSQVRGDLSFAGGLHLDGQIDGNVEALQGQLSVSEHGVVTGSVAVPQVLLDGTVRGDIVARERLVLGPNAQVHGDVQYGAIEMAPGARINGKLVCLAGPRSGQGLEST